MTTGILCGIGVGSGDPDLIPVRAIRILSRVDPIFPRHPPKITAQWPPISSGPHPAKNCVIEKPGFPMRKDKAMMEAAWRRHARGVVGVLEAGRSAGFLTLGDPLIYST
jgi:precorrin-2/cobalt-factor-2 C20-methyltransferase